MHARRITSPLSTHLRVAWGHALTVRVRKVRQKSDVVPVCGGFYQTQ